MRDPLIRTSLAGIFCRHVGGPYRKNRAFLSQTISNPKVIGIKLRRSTAHARDRSGDNRREEARINALIPAISYFPFSEISDR